MNPPAEPYRDPLLDSYEWRVCWDVLSEQGKLAMLTDNLDVAEECHTRAATIALAESSDQLILARSLTALAAVKIRLKKYDDVHSYLSAALEIRTKQLPEWHPEIGEVLQLQACLQFSLQNYQAACDLYICAIRALWILPDHHPFKLQCGANLLKAQELRLGLKPFSAQTNTDTDIFTDADIPVFDDGADAA
jgi:hypothetical protein